MKIGAGFVAVSKVVKMWDKTREVISISIRKWLVGCFQYVLGKNYFRIIF